MQEIASRVWRQQSMWSATANRMKASIGRARLGMLIATVAGAVLATAAAALATAAPGWSRSLAVAAAVSVGLVPILRPGCTGTVIRDWTRARSVAEALKSETYQLLAHVGDYAGADPNGVLRSRTDAVVRGAGDLLPRTVDVVPADRPLPDVSDVESYFRIRVAGQIDGFYRPRAAGLRTLLRRLAAVQVGLAVLGVVLAAVAATFPEAGVGAWVAVATTVGTAVTAHSAAGRLDYQLIEYLRTAEELERLRDEAVALRFSDAAAPLVAECERIISIQNEGWMAKLAGEPAVEPGAPAG